jgi:hypothetical protein
MKVLESTFMLKKKKFEKEKSKKSRQDSYLQFSPFDRAIICQFSSILSF